MRRVTVEAFLVAVCMMALLLKKPISCVSASAKSQIRRHCYRRHRRHNIVRKNILVDADLFLFVRLTAAA